MACNQLMPLDIEEQIYEKMMKLLYFIPFVWNFYDNQVRIFLKLKNYQSNIAPRIFH